MHEIRLAGPWLAHASGGQQTRVTLPWQPTDWGSGRLQRRFGRPGQLDPGERVFLVIEGLAGDATVTVNERELFRDLKGRSIRSDITDCLVPDNQLVIAWSNHSTVGLDGPVRLEIEQP